MSVKIKGHALKPVNPRNIYRWECYCGAWGTCMPMPTAMGRANARRNEHNEHKVNVLREQGKWEHDDEQQS